MQVIELNLPDTVKLLFNHLYNTKSPEYLGEDLLAITLPGEKILDVGWYPSHDPSGAYHVVVASGNWKNIETKVITTNLDNVLDTVKSICGS